MPTGSLCSERNAIGNALAANPALADRTCSASRSSPSERRTPAAERARRRRRRRKRSHRRASRRSCRRGGERWGGGGGLAEVAAEGLCRPTSGADLAGLNPLRPCGLQGWLIKIAEVNPGFKVLMFSDVTCEEVFVRGVEQC